MLKKSTDSISGYAPQPARKKKLTKGELFQKACNFCVYQERTQQEVRDKLYELGLSAEEVEEFLVRLIVENFVNEERFAKAYAGGRFRTKKWGRNKIIKELKARNISDYCIKKGIAEINERDYQEVLKDLTIKKAEATREFDKYQKKNKIANFLINKGYESDLVWDMIKKLV